MSSSVDRALWSLVLAGPWLAAACGAPPQGLATRDAAPGAAPPLAAQLAIVDVAWVDVRAGERHEHGSILVRDGRIVAVGPADSTPVPPGTPRLEGDGLTLVPGLWDLHVHDLHEPEVQAALLDHGVTAVRSMGGPPAETLALRGDGGAPGAAGLRVVAAGPWIDGPWQHAPPDDGTRWFVETEADGRAVVARLAALGVDLVKVHDRVPAPALEGLAAACAAHDLPWGGHVPRGLAPLDVVALGPITIEHASQLAERVLTRAVVDDPERLDDLVAAWERGPGARLAQALIAHGTGWVPTLVASEALTRAADGSAWQDPRVAGVPEARRAEWRSLVPDPERFAWFAAQRVLVDQLARRQLRFLHEQGVTVGAGSDLGAPHVYPGSGLHDELASLEAAGLSPAAVLRAATCDAAILAGRGRRSGSLEVGRDADVLLVAGDPLTDLSVLRTPRAVVVAGRRLR